MKVIKFPNNHLPEPPLLKSLFRTLEFYEAGLLKKEAYDLVNLIRPLKDIIRLKLVMAGYEVEGDHGS